LDLVLLSLADVRARTKGETLVWAFWDWCDAHILVPYQPHPTQIERFSGAMGYR